MTCINFAYDCHHTCFLVFQYFRGKEIPMDTTLPIFILYVQSQERSKLFYKSVLMKEPRLDVPGMTEFMLTDHSVLGLMPENGIAKILSEKTPHPSEGNGIPRNEIYLYVEDPENYYDRAIRAGGKEISKFEERNWGDSVAYCSDPDGHILAFSKKTGK
jgi:predicted enzyme related to lactoylglutathione lyase